MSLDKNFCALCGIVKPQTKFLYSDESQQFGTVMKINQLFKQILHVPNYHNHPKYICSDCELSVHHFYKFWEMVQKAQKNLCQQNEKSKNPLFLDKQSDSKHTSGPNLCHTTGITKDSEPVLIKIDVVKQIQCDTCKTDLRMTQLIALHQVTHGLGTVLCQCEQCGHQDDIGTFLQEKNNVTCPQCSFRKFNQTLTTRVDVQTQFMSNDSKTSCTDTDIIKTGSKQDGKFPRGETLYITDEKYHSKEYLNRIDLEQMSSKEYPLNRVDLDQTNSKEYSMDSLQQIDENAAFQVKYEPLTPKVYKPCSSANTSSELQLNTSTFSATSPITSCSEFKIRATFSAANGPAAKTKGREKKPHVCDVCARVFHHKGHLKRHMLVHDKSVQHFLCHECGRRFNQKSSLQTHWTHVHCKDKSVDNEFQCVWCGQIYKHKMNLKSHLLSNHNKNATLKTNFFCNICNKYFITQSRLNSHAKIHEGVKEYECHVCKKAFCQKNNLNVHLKKHCPPD